MAWWGGRWQPGKQEGLPGGPERHWEPILQVQSRGGRRVLENAECPRLGCGCRC